MNPHQIMLGVFITMAAAITGLFVKLYYDQNRWTWNTITWTELFLGVAITAIVVAPIGVNIGWKMAWDNTVTYNENWNGWEIAAVSREITCKKNGSCKNTYSCDPYPCRPHPCNCTCTSRDSDGRCTSESCSTCYDTCYDSCPYATLEYVNTVATTLGDFVIDDHVFSLDPVEWRRGSGIPDRVQRGPSQFWLAAKVRCESGAPGPVVKRMTYKNYLLASDQTILKQYSDMIEQYKAAGFLPDPQRAVYDFYMADKVYFVGYQPLNPKAWQTANANLNAALGTELQGDLHLVIVQSSLVAGNPDAYIAALKAYWQDSKIWKKDTVSKNTIIVVIGTADGLTVSWGRAITGMPLGNEYMINEIRNRFAGINSVPLTPDTVIGSIRGEFYLKTYDDGSQKVKVRGLPLQPYGVLQDVLWGLSNPASTFTRISMSADDTDDVGSGFQYLANEIKPSAGAQFMIVFVVFLLSSFVWWLMTSVDIGNFKHDDLRRRSRNRF